MGRVLPGAVARSKTENRLKQCRNRFQEHCKRVASGDMVALISLSDLKNIIEEKLCISFGWCEALSAVV
eukprot:12036661-Heterocapsa_arctica.AAC.1